ncbi:Heavy metal-associated isoprenylated plant protein 26 [Nymphaea thermarum]|nr:Heavy metal-associated isoprenylated plant protein 26 [Nymphaea thermarum]
MQETKEEEKKQEEEKKDEGGGEGKEGGEAEADQKKEGGGGEEEKKEGGEGEKKEEENPEIVLKVDMHCEGCARKVQRSLRGFPGVEEVYADSKSHRVTVKGKDADPVKVCERIQKKSGKKVEIISPLPKPPEEEKKEEEQPKQEEEKKEEVSVHVYLCSVYIYIYRIRHISLLCAGVESVETDLKNDQVIVKGVVDPEKLVEYIYRQTRKQATIVPPPPPPPEEEKKEEEAKKEEKEEGEKKEGEEGKGEEELKSEAKKSEYWPYWPPPRHYYAEQAYAPQIFSDENPNACSVM